MEGKKAVQEDLAQMTADELIKVRTGYGNVEDAKTLGYLKQRNLKRSPYREAGKSKWSVLRAKSKNKNLKKNKAINAQLEKKLNSAQANWSEAIRGINFLRKNEGIGGGHLPEVSRKMRSQSSNRKLLENERKSNLQQFVKKGILKAAHQDQPTI